MANISEKVLKTVKLLAKCETRDKNVGFYIVWKPFLRHSADSRSGKVI